MAIKGNCFGQTSHFDAPHFDMLLWGKKLATCLALSSVFPVLWKPSVACLRLPVCRQTKPCDPSLRSNVLVRGAFPHIG